MVDKVKVKERWKNLNNWQDLLIKFRDCYKGASLGEENLTTIKGSAYRGSLAHLEGLAELHSNQKFTSLVQNFRGAALHWTMLHETAHLGTDRLPAMPQSLSGIVDPDIIRQLNTRYKLHTQQKMDAYLRQHTQGELVLPLHLSLMISPCFLLMPINLVKSKFPRQAVFQVSVSNSLSTYHLKCSIVSCALGNQKPEILLRVEKEIWKAFASIRQDSSLPVIMDAFHNLFESNAVLQALSMSPTDPAFSFFRRKRPHNILLHILNSI